MKAIGQDETIIVCTTTRPLSDGEQQALKANDLPDGVRMVVLPCEWLKPLAIISSCGDVAFFDDEGE